MITYSIWDIPSVMLAVVKNMINKNCIIELVNADDIMDEVIKITKDSKVAVIFRKI